MKGVIKFFKFWFIGLFIGAIVAISISSIFGYENEKVAFGISHLIAILLASYKTLSNTNKGNDNSTEIEDLKGQLSEKSELAIQAKKELDSQKNKIVSMQNQIIDYQEQINKLKENTEAKESTPEANNEKLTFNEEKLKIQLEEWRGAAEKFANFYTNDHFKILCKRMTSNNYESNKASLERVFDRLKKYKITFQESQKDEFYTELKEAFKVAVKKEEARIEQLRIKEQIREEQKAERERQAEIKKLEDQEAAIAKALQEAMMKAENKHSAEIQSLQAQLEEMRRNTERAKSQAQLTRSGHVYVISNLGAFGDDLYKIGMTRRLEPMDRIKELGGASVPFSFDVHMMISCDDAPNLETNLHKELHKFRANKVNLRKEFFKVKLEDIAEVVEKHHGTVEYIAEKEALDYRETLLIEENGDYENYFDEDTIQQAEQYDEETEEAA